MYLHTHAVVPVPPLLFKVSSGTQLETRPVVGHPFPLQEQDEALLAANAAVVLGALQTALTLA